MTVRAKTLVKDKFWIVEQNGQKLGTLQKQLPVYTKTPKSKSQFCAGYYIICFEKGWRKAYCPKMITLSRYDYKGPMKTKLEMQQVLNNAVKEFQDSN